MNRDQGKEKLEVQSKAPRVVSSKMDHFSEIFEINRKRTFGVSCGSR